MKTIPPTYPISKNVKKTIVYNKKNGQPRIKILNPIQYFYVQLYFQDENCFKIHWSSVLLSLVSYILLAITLLLCLSCFARVLIQWSVRSSLAELRTANSPTGSFRSSSRFFSFLGTTITGRWERPPPTYDEALKHVNPDLARPTAPPPYNDFVESSDRRGSSVSHGIVETPPPEYQSQEHSLHRLHMIEVG